MKWYLTNKKLKKLKWQTVYDLLYNAFDWNDSSYGPSIGVPESPELVDEILSLLLNWWGWKFLILKKKLKTKKIK